MCKQYQYLVPLFKDETAVSDMINYVHTVRDKLSEWHAARRIKRSIYSCYLTLSEQNASRILSMTCCARKLGRQPSCLIVERLFFKRLFYSGWLSRGYKTCL